MPKPTKRSQKAKGQQQPETLKGWKQVSEFLGEPASVVKRWAADGMPAHREGQFVSTSSDELNAWLGQESGKPVHVATEYRPHRRTEVGTLIRSQREARQN